jgi:uncharacterized membrane protein
MRGALCLLLALGLGSAACGTVAAFMPLNEPPHPLEPRPALKVEMFTTSQPTRPFVEVGLISIGIASVVSGSSDLMILADARVEAGKHGCDGLVLKSENKMASGGNIQGQVNVSERTAGFRLVCIVYTDGVAAPPPPVPPPPVPPPPVPSPPAKPALAPVVPPPTPTLRPAGASCTSHLSCAGGLVCPSGRCVTPSCVGDKDCGSDRSCSLEGQCVPPRNGR